MRSRLAAVLAAAALAAPVPATAQSALPTPASILGFDPGTDRKLPEWKQVVAYFTGARPASPRLQLRTLGKTTLGRPFLAAFIADSATLANLPRHQDARAPARRSAALIDDAERAAARARRQGRRARDVEHPLHRGRRHPHAARCSPTGSSAARTRRRARSARTRSSSSCRRSTPTAWTSSATGTAARSAPRGRARSRPSLYHYYTGHDNNRDWYAFTQAETRMVIDSLYSTWHPQIVNDIHQQGANGDAHLHPAVHGSHRAEHRSDPDGRRGADGQVDDVAHAPREGFTGVANNTSYDAWTPARAYQHYHGAIRILTETASASLASPITVAFDSLRPGYNVDPKTAGVDFLTRVDGRPLGRSATSCATRPARRGRCSRRPRTTARCGSSSYARVQRNAVMGERGAGPRRLAGDDRDPRAGRARHGGERGAAHPAARAGGGAAHERGVHRGRDELSGRQLPRSTPRSRTARSRRRCSRRRRIPNLREYPGGPPKRPYDVTAHTLPLLYGFDVAFVKDSVTARVDAAARCRRRRAGPRAGCRTRRARRIAIFRNYAPSMDEGWTRWVFDQYRIPFTVVTATRHRAGNLSSRFDAIMLPEQNARADRARAAGRVSRLAQGRRRRGGRRGARGVRRRGRDADRLQRRERLRDRGAAAAGEERARRRCGRRSSTRRARSSRSRSNASHPLAAGLTAPAAGGVVREQPGVRDHRCVAGDGRRALSGAGQPAALRLAAGRREARRQGRAGGRARRARGTWSCSASARSTARRAWRRTRCSSTRCARCRRRRRRRCSERRRACSRAQTCARARSL